ncbi:MAG: hypothetical protein ACREJ2_04870 [Planctomycetota bacterium]
MKERLSVRIARTSRNLLRSRVGSRTSSLIYVSLAAVFCVGLSLIGYLRGEGAKVQFVRVTYNTGLSFQAVEWGPTRLVVRGLHFDPHRGDPNSACAPGRLFDAVAVADVDRLTVDFGWSFLPQPTSVDFHGVRPTVELQKVPATIQWLQSLPPSAPRTFAITIDDCRPRLADVLDAAGAPLGVPAFSVTLGPEIDGDFAYNVVMADMAGRDTPTLRINDDGHGALSLLAGNWKIDPARWAWLRAALAQNAAHEPWLLRNLDGIGPPEGWPAWSQSNDLVGTINFSLWLAKESRTLRSLSAQSEITDLHLIRHAAAPGEPQTVDLTGTLAMQAHFNGRSGGFQASLGAGNDLRFNFDRSGQTAPVPLLWDGWIEHNPDFTFFRLAGSYHYHAELARSKPDVGALLALLPNDWGLQATNVFACTSVDGAELRAQLRDGAAATVFLGQSDMRHYDASLSASGPQEGPAAGSSAELHLHLAARSKDDPDAALPPPVTFEAALNSDRFPVPGQPYMFYTGQILVKHGSFTRRWLDQLLLDRNIAPLNIFLATAAGLRRPFPFLDAGEPRESLAIDDMEIRDGRLVAGGAMPFFVRNVNGRLNVAFDSLDPFSGRANILELRGAQTGFGEHIVEFGPERLQGTLTFNLGSLFEGGEVAPWQDRANGMAPDNLFYIELHSTARAPSENWNFSLTLPWYMTRARPANMQVRNFPAALYPPGLQGIPGIAELTVKRPGNWGMSCWIEPGTVGEGALAPAALTALPEADAAAGARIVESLAHHDLPGRRLLVVHRRLDAEGIQVTTTSQLDADDLNLPDVGDTTSYPYPRE